MAQGTTQLADAIQSALEDYAKLKRFMEGLGISEPSLSHDVPAAIVLGHLLLPLVQDIMAAPEA